MKYVSVGRLKTSLDALRSFHPFFGVTLISMLRGGVNTERTITWGSTDENALLNEYFTPPGAPPTKPYFIPFGQPDKTHGFWRNEKYSAGALQSARTREAFASALVHPSKREWKFGEGFIETLRGLLPRINDQPRRIPVLDLAAWYYRSIALPDDLPSIVAKFRGDFSIVDEQMFAELFDGSTEEPADNFFFDVVVSEGDLRPLTGGIPAGPTLGNRSEEQLLDDLEAYLGSTAKLILPSGFVRNFYFSLKAQRFVVLVGRPGTGKTAFARAFARGLNRLFPDSVHEVIVSVGQDQGESQTIGYAKIAGGLEATELTRELFLSDNRRDVFLVILDEMNLAQADHYLARLLPAIESDASVQLPGCDGQYRLPTDTFFVGTANSFLEENSRIPLSGPVKRRTNVIEMPNILDEVLADERPNAFLEFCLALLEQTHARLQQRGTEEFPGVLDKFRIADLEIVLSGQSPRFNNEVIALLRNVVVACARSPLTRLSPGVLQDVVDYLGMAVGVEPIAAIDRQIAQKIVPQLNGPATSAMAVREILATYPTGEVAFPHSISALDALLESADPSSGLVYFSY